jgi:hypothetical protein
MQKNNNKKPASAVTKAAVVLAGLLCVFVVIIIAEYWRGRYSSLLDSKELEAIHEQLKQDPGKTELKDEIRKKDLELREEFFRRQTILEKGRYIIAGAAILLLICVKYLISLKPKLPKKKIKE